jgi:hypothetical protein
MHRCLVLVAVASALVVAGCGGGSNSSSDNVGKIEAATESTTSVAATEATLLKRTGAPVGSDFTVAAGECSVDFVAGGSQAAMYEEDEWALMSPDGSLAVKVLPVGSTPPASCLEAVDEALGWNELN